MHPIDKPLSKDLVISIAAYRPRPGKTRQLRNCVKVHNETLKSQKLITNRKPIVMQAKDGTILEVFEWKSEQAIADAHENPVVRRLWKRFDACCTYVSLRELDETAEVFAGFAPMNLWSKR